MPARLEIAAAWERTDEGSPEERACFALFTMASNGIFFTQGEDYFVKRLRNGPLVSAYPAAEWFAWNWWRLRWEPRSVAPDWAFTHRMTSIGEGYVWPNVTIFSDGVRTALIAKPSSRPDAKPFRYICDFATVVPSIEFEGAVDAFLDQVRSQLVEEKLSETNLDRLWRDLASERGNPEMSRRRRLEALMGCDPDEADPNTLDQLMADIALLGEPAMEEVAAGHDLDGDVLTAQALHGIAERSGYAASPRDAAALKSGVALRRGADVPAWQLGSQAAIALRAQEHLGAGPIDNTRLAALAGTQAAALGRQSGGPSMSFALDENSSGSRIVLRSKWEPGRRFELARLIGDRIVGPKGNLYPATRAGTYRQKVQRSFAAEFLSPFTAVEEMLAGDCSADSRQDVADYFNVSDHLIRTLLVNHRRLAHDYLDDDIEGADLDEAAV